MKNKIFIVLILCFFLTSLLYAIDYQIDSFHNEYIENAIEIENGINMDLDMDILLFNNYAFITQIGDLNQAYQHQYGISDIASIYQEGFSNYAYQQQNGNYNQAYIIEKGSNNEAYQYQYNNHNTGIIILIGNGNYAYQYQTGHSTNIIIHQGNGAIISQND